MSAIIAVAKSDRLEILTDTASICPLNGSVNQFARKQIFEAVPGCVICLMTWAPIGDYFAAQSIWRCKDFDDLVEFADELWQDALTIVPKDGELERLGFPFYGVTYAGWSQKRQAFEIYILDNLNNKRAVIHEAFVMPPALTANEIIGAFFAKIETDLDSFDAIRDGITLMKELRQHSAQLPIGEVHLVGGNIEHTVLTKSGRTTEVIHSWPDIVGDPIRPENILTQ